MRTLRRIAALTALTTSALAAVGCGGTRQQAGPVQRPVVLTTSQLAALRGYGIGDTTFGLSLLSSLCHDSPGSNAVISPVSLATGLGMTYLGARGATAAAMARVLHLPAATLASQVSGLGARSALLRSLDRPGVAFSASNRIWADPSLHTNRSFVAALRSGYQAGLTALPLLSSPEQARRQINSAIAADTRGHIPALLKPGSLGQVGWVLTDALYLNARWASPFSHQLTNSGAFHAPGGQVTARYLNGEGFAVGKSGGWTAASLPYRGHRLSMLALLPPAGAAGCQIPAAATISALAAQAATGKQRMGIALPKVKLSASYSLKDALAKLGMGLAFTPAADFSGLSPQACCIGFVQHAATLDVAEKGTIASAATAVGILPSSAQITLTFDRPYLLLLRDGRTGEPLMLAWVANPASS